MSALALLWALVLAGASLTAAVRARALRRAAPREGGDALSLLLVRPATGSEVWLESALFSTAHAGLPARTRVIFTTARETDPATVIARRAAARLQRHGLFAVVLVADHPGPNLKVAQLACAVRAFPDAEVIAVADADVDLAGLDLCHLVAPLADRGVGATWSPVVEHARGTPGDRASSAVLGASLHAFSLLCGIDPAGLVGKLFAVRAEALSRVGGFTGLVETLGEDMELSRRLRRRGLWVRPVPQGARSFAAGRSMPATVGRFARWITVIRTQRPALLLAYPAFFLATVPLLVLAGVGAVSHPGVAGLAIGLSLSTRLFQAVAATRLSGLRRRPVELLRDMALADQVLWRAFFRALATRRVEWAGRRLIIGRGGAIRGAG